MVNYGCVHFLFGILPDDVVEYQDDTVPYLKEYVLSDRLMAGKIEITGYVARNLTWAESFG